jgi:knotted carbamoyltransferase YgeW
MPDINQFTSKLDRLNFRNMFENDFFLTWEKTFDELVATFTVADALRSLREDNISAKIFDSGLGISLFRDNSTRTRFSFASACNLLGLLVQDLDECKSQIAHGETVRETANMISFMADVIGIRDDMYIGKGNAYMRAVADAVREGRLDGVLEQRPTLVNLQCDIDHPTQCMADMNHIIRHFGGIENLKGKKVAMTWAYSPSYGKPLSVPQGVAGLFTRFGMDVHLAHPKGYEVMPQVEEVARGNALLSGGKFTKSNSMEEAFRDADIVYPKSWAPFAAMEKRTTLYDDGDEAGIKALEKELLAENANHKDWECSEKLMRTTRDGEALYLHCLPADISGLSCKEGEVEASVFDRYRIPLYKQAGHKPYIIAAMIFLSKVKYPQKALTGLASRSVALGRSVPVALVRRLL